MSQTEQAPWPTIAIAALVACILLAGLTMYFYAKVSDMERRTKELESLLSRYTVRANLLINFGNGTRPWYNGTRVSVGSTLLNLTIEALGDKQVVAVYSQYGAFLESIAGVGSEKVKPNCYWLWWTWNAEMKEWEAGQVGADAYKVRDGDILAWYYQDTSTWPRLEKP